MGVSPFELLQNPSGRIRRGSPAATDGAGIHLEDFACRDECIHRIERGSPIAQACFVKEMLFLIELRQQVEMPDNLRARFVGDAFKLGKIAFRRRVAVAAENFRQKAARRFRAAVHGRISRRIAADGEGAKHMITCTVEGATDEAQAERIAKSVISSTLTKAAIFGADANWGRVLCAMGYSGEAFDPDKVDVSFISAAGSVAVCAQGRGLDFDEEAAKRILTEHDVTIAVAMGEGNGACTCWGCDITYDYIKINGDYRT